MIVNEDSNVKNWYVETYTNDELGQEINDNVTFYDVFYALDRYKNVYDIIGIEDSVIRERIFQKLSEIMSCSYNYIYEQWIMSE